MRNDPVTFWLIILVGITLTLGGYCLCCGCPGTLCDGGTLPSEQQCDETSGAPALFTDADHVFTPGAVSPCDASLSAVDLTLAADFTVTPAATSHWHNFLDDRGITAGTCVYTWFYQETFPPAFPTVEFDSYFMGVLGTTQTPFDITLTVWKFLDQGGDVRMVAQKKYQFNPTANDIEYILEYYHLNLGAGPADCCGGPWDLDGFNVANFGVVVADGSLAVVANGAGGCNWNTPGTLTITPVC